MGGDINHISEYLQKLQKELDPRKQKRGFTGVWIPKIIWFDEKLSAMEKLLFAEIYSLDTEEFGCYAKNEYFSKFFGIKERQLQNYIASLKSKGYIYQDKFNGRVRILKVSIQFKKDNPRRK